MEPQLFIFVRFYLPERNLDFFHLLPKNYSLGSALIYLEMITVIFGEPKIYSEAVTIDLEATSGIRKCNSLFGNDFIYSEAITIYLEAGTTYLEATAFI
jgi:hypothetical protein